MVEWERKVRENLGKKTGQGKSRNFFLFFQNSGKLKELFLNADYYEIKRCDFHLKMSQLSFQALGKLNTKYKKNCQGNVCPGQ